jgi:phosphoserine phosphatase
MRWPHFDHVFFDCDSTLTSVEGIDILAETAGKKWRVEILTQAAMDGALDLEDIYAKRLEAVRPTRSQIQDIRRAYKRHAVEDASRVVTALQALGHHVYIISGGLAEPVEEFAVFLGIPRERVRAVGVTYNELAGRWWEHSDQREHLYLDYAAGALTVSDGKAEIVAELRGNQPGRALLIGDGNSDLLAARAVDLFVGYGGVVTRSKVLAEAPAFIHSPSLAPLLPIAGGPAAMRSLRTWSMPYQSLATKATYLIRTGALTFHHDKLESRFRAAFFPADQPTRETIHPGTY